VIPVITLIRYVPVVTLIRYVHVITLIRYVPVITLIMYVPVITLIRYAHIQKIGKPNTFKFFGCKSTKRPKQTIFCLYNGNKPFAHSVFDCKIIVFFIVVISLTTVLVIVGNSGLIIQQYSQCISRESIETITFVSEVSSY
jgi:hypothetical protein